MKDSVKIINMDSRIAGTITIYTDTYVFTEETINKVKTGGVRDPENKIQTSPTTNTKITNKGTNSTHIKKMLNILLKANRFSEIYQHSQDTEKRYYYEQIKKYLFDILMEIDTLIETFSELNKEFNVQINKIVSQQQEILLQDIITNDININNLDKYVKTIIINNSSQILNKISFLIIEIYKNTLTKSKQKEIIRHDKDLWNTVAILLKEKIITTDSKLYSFISQYHKNFLEKFLSIRNSLEHPDYRKSFEIENFFLNEYRKYNLPLYKFTHPKYNEIGDLLQLLKYIINNIINGTYSILEILINDELK